MLLKLCVLTIAVLIIYSVIVIFKKTRHLPFSRIKSYLFAKRAINARVLVALFVFVIVVFAGFNMNKNSKKQAVITLNYAEASNAQNPNGTRFDMAEIICTDVLERAIEKGGFEDITAKDLKKCLSVTPTVEGDSSSEDDYHISTEFMLEYMASSKTGKLDAENVVKLVGDAYKEFCIEKYADDFSVLNIDEEELETANEGDYPDIISYLQMKFQEVSNYMYRFAEENGSFTSSSGETFYSVAEKANNLNSEQVGNNLKAYVYQYGISKNASKYIKRLEYQNTLLDYDAQRARSSYNTRNTAVNMYAEQMARIVLVPTLDTDSQFYMGRTKIGVDALSVEAESYSKKYGDLINQIEANSVFDAALKTSSYPGGNSTDLDEFISNIEDELVKIARSAKNVGQEYSETRFNDCVTVSVTDNTLISKAVTLLMLTVLFFLALRLFVIARELVVSNDMSLFFRDSEKEKN